MSRRLAAAGLVAVVSVACAGAAAGSERRVVDAWARATPAGASVGAVYLRIDGATGDSLVAASVDPAVAASVELHATTRSDGMATMDAQPRLDASADGTITLEPGGDHAMLVDLASPLEAGETFDVTLELADGGTVRTTVEVREDPP